MLMVVRRDALCGDLNILDAKNCSSVDGQRLARDLVRHCEASLFDLRGALGMS
jgi:hypothetical protein